MGVQEIFKVPINKRKIVTIPDEVMKLLGAKIGDDLIFKIEDDLIILGLLEKTVVEEKTRFKIIKS